MLREITIKIGLERINTQKGVTVEVLLDSEAIGLIISLEYTRKYEFKLKKIERPIYMRNVNDSFNKERPIEYTVEVNIYYQGYRKRTEINVIEGQKWNVILEILWLTCYNPEINQRIEEIKMTRYPEECRKQWRPKQKIGLVEAEEEREEKERKKEMRRKRAEERREEKKNPKKERTMEVKKLVKEWEIWDDEEEVAKLETEARGLVLECFYKWIQVFGKNASEQMSTRKVWDYAIDTKEGFVLRKDISIIKREGVQVYF